MDRSTPAPHRILVVEDEPVIAESVAARLRSEGHLVEVSTDGLAAVEDAARFRPDLIVLDVMLPGIDGLEVCRRVQAARPVPVLMLTARDEETDLLVGLAVGADDYLTKPFSMRELAARVRVLLRRVSRYPGAETDAAVHLGDLVVDPATRETSRAGEPVHLTALEFDLLWWLCRRPGAVATREQLLTAVWGWAGPTASRTVDSHVRSLRRKLGAELIRTVHGVGYALQPPDR
ncbi:DNA-binding response OmpR family regulator [Stackebrandtia albiflava]|uniref:DNA-binding response OmpR family regulator n=1 Tax=Stackebrandtia albiflava TaxID=406432 RepID=A0A562VEH5_9ACTN|nr:response regulator transcription factor [Stackebrandtia albiflava]TWJ16258.1 DNA-binding response OmpR family regulator [Stackebrandtia albiflava]